ncbi:MAG TPA: valine--tRNA ligase [Candidatus Baltobacteraceae bacterium]|nr:valine--tRNA ligase [Candidatus Baltobacteraceae bacterium]
MTDLPKHYDPASVEPRLYARWEAGGYFHQDPEPDRPPFIICMPPPNVTGRAHLGHGSTYAPMDALTRYHRMLGDNADWLPGLDHAAVATEAVLVKELAREGATRDSLGRAAYLERAWSWASEYGGTIFEQFRKLGFGPDWQRSRFTMDDRLSAAVRKVFVTLYRDGLIYRGKRLINWDPQAQTTISDAEVDHVERDAHLWRIRYPCAGDEGASIEISTTRPETMLGDVAIAVHPHDERYRPFVGRSVLVPPLLEREIPVIADEAVDPEFGTGAVKVTPAHDATDYEIGLRHKLPMPSILDAQSRVTGEEIGVGPYAGMNREAARKAILEELRARKLLMEERPYRHAVAVSERTGAIVEPMLSLQWFVSMKTLAEPALAAYRDGRLRFTPARYGRTYEQWLTNIRDWNISRQVWWGHQLPVWYTPEGEIVVAESEEEARLQAQTSYGFTGELTREADTLDTWFSSALWPFSILGWPDETPELRYWYPSQVLITGWEIIFLWVARMVMLGLRFMGEVPFPQVFVAPLIFDAQGRKMSKSLGNAIDPLDLVQKYGADAFRMGMMRQMRLEAQDVRFQESRCEEARNFNNKVWNATRYAIALPEGLPTALTLPGTERRTLADRWILTRLADTAQAVTSALNAYDFGTVAETLWRFIWYELCDWYLEATKAEAARETRAAVLSFVINNAMRLLHPVEPFISEEVWLTMPHDGPTIMTSAWPDVAEIPVDREAAQLFESLRGTVERLRNLRAEIGMQPKDRLTIEVPEAVNDDLAALLALYAAGNVMRIAGPAKTNGAGDLLAAVRGIAPAQILTQRYQKEALRLRAEVERGEQKLGNQRFVANAKPEVVAKEREKLDDYRAELARVQARLDEMGGKRMTASSLKRRVLVGSAEIDRIVARLAHQILEPEDAQDGLYLIGIRRGGESLAQRIAAQVERISGHKPPLGFLNINLYRDDEVTHELPESQIPADVTGKTVVIIDDVLYTGRTVRSALDAVTDLGRPAAVRLCVMVDRGLRELPVQADYVGRFIPTSRRERVAVSVQTTASPSDEVAIVADAT